MPTAKDDPSRNAFESDLAGTAERTRAEGKIENLRLEGGIFVEAVRATRMPMAVTDPTLPGNPIVFANQSFLRLSGYSMEEVLGQQPHFMNGPDTDPDDVARFEEALRADQDDIVETVQYRKDGTRFLASVLLSAFKDDKGRTVHHFLSWLDVTRRQNAENRLSLLQQAQSALRESEERQAFLLKLSDSLRPMQNAVEIQNAAMRYLAEQLNVARAGYYEVGADQDSFSLAARWERDTPSLPDMLKMSDFGTEVGEAYRAGRTLISRDIERESPSAIGREMYRRIGTRARIGVPLVKEGRLLTVVAVHSNPPRDWTSAEIQLVEAVAERTWDAVERARAEAALRESEARLKAAIESVPAGLAVLDLNGSAVIANAEFRRFLPNGVIPSRDPEHVDRWQGWSGDGRLLDPKDWPSARALRGERVVPGQQMLYIDDEGHRIWTNVATAPTLNGDGHVTGVVTVISDIDAIKRAQEALRESEQHAQLLLAELQHRVRNTLAVVRSIARRTAENSSTADDMLSHFQGRLDAFSRTQAALTRNAEGTVDLTSLIEDELVAHASREGEQVHIDGVAIALQPRAAERVSLAVHELMTNAVKHGALRSEEGEIRISWRLSEPPDNDLLFNWIESGVEIDTSAERREGFGMELLLRSLPHDVDGESSVDLTPGGLRFQLRMNLPAK